MTDTQADLTERARAVAVRIAQTDFGDDPLDPITLMTSWIAAFAQSEREAAAAEAWQEMLGVLRTVENATASPFYTDKEREAIKHCFDTAREGIADLRALASPAPQDDLEDDVKHGNAEYFRAALAHAAAEARRAAIEECAQQVGSGRWLCSENCEGPQRIRALASPRAGLPGPSSVNATRSRT